MSRLRIVGGHVVDARSPEPRPNQAIVVENGRIVSVGGGGAADGDIVVDAAGGYVLPGLWEAHCHPGGLIPDPTKLTAFETGGERALRAFRNLASVLTRGVTTVRAVGDAAWVDIALRDAAAAGTVTAPRMFCAGPCIKTTGGHGAYRRVRSVYMDAYEEVDGPEQVRQAARKIVKMGADWIKLLITGGIAGGNESMTELQMTAEEIAVACQVAHRKGLRACAHLGAAEAVKVAVGAGLDSVEHGYALDEEAVARMARKGTYYIPTLSVTQDEAFMYRWKWPQHSIDRALAGARRHREGFQMALAAGVKICAGADLNPMAETAIPEIEWLARCGMTAHQAITAATLRGAELCGAESDHGTIEPGKIADLIVMPKNPLENVSALRGVEIVVKEGRVVVDWRRSPALLPAGLPPMTREVPA
jgi:imidazolonepropionase-like amidohydrolase